MKKFFLLTIVLLIFIFSSSLFCQTKTDIIKAKYVYCELIGTAKFMSNKVTVVVDYGEEKGFFQGNAKIKDEATGKVQSFNSMVDALNYMGNEGWELAQAYTVTIGNQNVYHWLLKKEIK